MTSPSRSATQDRRDSAHGSGPPRKPGRPAAPPVSVDDWLMLLLAVVSVALLVWITFWDAGVWEPRVILADYVICGIFAIEFMVRWRRSGIGWKFPLLYWYEVLGMIPLSHPAFRAFRLLRIVVVVARLARAADRAFGDRFTGYIVDKFADTIVNVIRRPVTVAVLDEVIPVIAAGNYATHLSSAIDENRAELDALIAELIKEDRSVGRMRYVPFHDRMIQQTSDTAFRITKRALDDPRVHELISDVIRESAVQLKDTIRSKQLADVRRELEADLAQRRSSRKEQPSPAEA